MLTGMQRIEIRVSVNTKDDSLAIDDEMLLAVLPRGFDNPWEALCPIVSASGKLAAPDRRCAQHAGGSHRT
jgi:hypothetical protein